MTQNLGVYKAVLLPPGGNPKYGTVLAEAKATNPGEVPGNIRRLLDPGVITVTWTCDTPIKRLSETSLAKRRRTILRNRLQKKFPLFADQFEQQELAARPDFYAGRR